LFKLKLLDFRFTFFEKINPLNSWELETKTQIEGLVCGYEQQHHIWGTSTSPNTGDKT